MPYPLQKALINQRLVCFFATFLANFRSPPDFLTDLDYLQKSDHLQKSAGNSKMSRIYTLQEILINTFLHLLLVGEGCEGVENDGEDAEGCVVCPQFGNGCALQIYRAENLYEVAWR